MTLKKNQTYALLKNFNEQSPSFLKRGEGRFYGIEPIEKSPFSKGGGRDRAKVDQFLPLITSPKYW